MDNKAKQKLDLARLRARAAEKPRTKAGQVRQAWPEIKALFEAGHSLRDVWTWLHEIGIEIGYCRLSDNIGQLRRREQAKQAAVAVPPTAPVANPEPATPATPPDPLANVRTREQKRDGFQYNSEPDSKKLI